MHINGFIHRDIKAANLLIDDDGTVLVGDLGVAAPLVDDSDTCILSTAQPDGRKTNPNLSAKACVGNPVRPHMGKRKSFVGTVCSPLSYPPFVLTVQSAVLDGPRTYRRKAVWHEGRHMVFWYHWNRANTRATAKVTGKPPNGPSSDVSAVAPLYETIV